MFLPSLSITKKDLFYCSVATLTIVFSPVGNIFAKQSKIDNEVQFNTHIRNINASAIKCLHSLTLTGQDRNDACKNTAALFDDFGVFLQDGDDDSNDSNDSNNAFLLLKDAKRANAYFRLMNEMHIMFCFLVMDSDNAPIGERVAKVFKTKHSDVYNLYLNGLFNKENNQEQKEHFKPFVWAQTYYAPVKASELATQDKSKSNKSDPADVDIVKRMDSLSDLITSAKAFGKEWPEIDDNFIFFYHTVMPFIIKFSEKYFINQYENEKSTIWRKYIFKPIYYYFNGTNTKKGESSKNSKNDTVNPEVIKANKIINKIVDNKKYPYKAMLMRELYNQYLETILTIYSYILRKVPTYRLTKDYFKSESDYRLNLFFTEPAHKLNFDYEKNNSFMQTSGLVEHYINNQLTPRLKDIEQKCNNGGYILSKEDQASIDDAHHYLLILLYAQVCDVVWKKQTGEYMWPRDTNPSVFAGFNKNTMSNIDYIVSLYSSQNNKT